MQAIEPFGELPQTVIKKINEIWFSIYNILL
jgi:hypothetical protein